MNQLKSPLIYLILIMSLGFTIRYFFLDTQMGDGSNISTEALFATSFPDENGKHQSLGQYRGKTIVLNFWATWCSPCREEMPELDQLHAEHANKNLVVLGLAVDDVGTIHEFAKEVKVHYPLFATDAAGMDIAQNLGNNKGVLPYTVLINPQGKIIKTFFGRVTKSLLEDAIAPPS